jgi:hypothetical protein
MPYSPSISSSVLPSYFSSFRATLALVGFITVGEGVGGREDRERERERERDDRDCEREGFECAFEAVRRRLRVGMRAMRMTNELMKLTRAL